MKRLLATVGLTYLSVLAVVFYFANGTFSNIIIILSALSAFIGIFLKLLKSKIKIKVSVAHFLITVGVTAFAACIAIVMYSNNIYQPIVDNYSNKELSVEGYICDEVQKSENSYIYVISADKINGCHENVKIRLVSIIDLQSDDFDRISANFTAERTDEGYNLSKGIYLTAFYNEESDSFKLTGEKQFMLYSIAVSIRKSMKSSLDALLPESTASLCKAVLLGDKQALSRDVKDDFSKTGTSFLIVVSGMHLSIIVGFILFFIKRIIKNRYARAAVVLATVLGFMAVTGFTPSVVRSGIMLILTYCSKTVFRRTDGLNSLGASAIVLTVFNPFSVGDIGMLLSFSATAGIILWAGKIESYLLRKFKFKGIRKFIRPIINLLAVSVSASLWTIPVATVAFHRITPFVVLTSLFAEPIVSVVLICAMFSALLYLCPIISFLAYPFAFAADIFGKLLLKIISLFSSIPYSCVNSDKPYFYVWLIFTALLVVIGYAIKTNGFYVHCAVTASTIVLTVGWAIYAIIGSNSAILKIYNVGSGVTASVECGSNISFISCGGTNSSIYQIIEDISGNFSSIDSIVIPNTKLKYSKYLPQLVSEFDVSNILVYDNNTDKKLIDNYSGEINTFSGDCCFTIKLNSLTTLNVINIETVTYQYLNINGSTVLFVSSKSDISKLPEKYRVCDYLLIDSNIKNRDLITCKNVVFSGEKELLESRYSSVKEISDSIYTTSDGNVKFVFSGGYNVKDK